MSTRVYGPLGEQLWLKLEEDNDSDPRAVAVLKHVIIVGHLPRKTARTVQVLSRVEQVTSFVMVHLYTSLTPDLPS